MNQKQAEQLDKNIAEKIITSRIDIINRCIEDFEIYDEFLTFDFKTELKRFKQALNRQDKYINQPDEQAYG